MRRPALAVAPLLLLCAAAAPAQPRPALRAPLGAADIDDVARLLMLEDRRELDAATLARLLDAPHPEVRRRAAVAVGRIADARGLALLRARPLDADTAVAASVVFAVGQLRDPSAVPWLDSLLASPATAPTVAVEAAASLGKIAARAADGGAAARAALARHLAGAPAGARARGTVAEALLAIGRAPARGDLAPIVRWTRSADDELRWRATWALVRPRDPAAVPALLALADDPAAEVRAWALRGLVASQADSAGLAARAATRLRAAVRDPDRRVRAEAVRALGTHADSASAAALVAALASPDAWIAVGAAEGLGRVRGAAATRALVAATAADRSCAVRATALGALQPVAPAEAAAAARAIARDTVPYCRATAAQALGRAAAATSADGDARAALEVVAALRDDPDATVRAAARLAHWMARDAALAPGARREARRAELARADAGARAAALRAMAAWADTSDLPWLLDQYEAARADTAADAGSAAAAAAGAVGAVQRRQGAGAAAFHARFAPPDDRVLRRDVERAFDAASRGWPPIPPVARPLADYRAIVERWVVPDLAGRPRPRVRWETPRGPVDLELYPGDAPLAVDDLVRATRSGAVVGTEFTRVVPHFVVQQRPVAGSEVLRDEVSRRRLVRGNLSWATAGLDTGIPGYTLGHTAQPHNEGDFTALGRVVRGMAAVDRIELGDRVTGARLLTAAPR